MTNCWMSFKIKRIGQHLTDSHKLNFKSIWFNKLTFICLVGFRPLAAMYVEPIVLIFIMSWNWGSSNNCNWKNWFRRVVWIGILFSSEWSSYIILQISQLFAFIYIWEWIKPKLKKATTLEQTQQKQNNTVIVKILLTASKSDITSLRNLRHSRPWLLTDSSE